MTSSIHDRARAYAQSRGIPIQAAYSELGRIGAARRQGRKPTANAPETRLRPKVRLWWQD